MVELRGFEPLTFSLRTRRATNCATAPCAREREGKVTTETGTDPNRGGAQAPATLRSPSSVPLVLLRPSGLAGQGGVGLVVAGAVDAGELDRADRTTGAGLVDVRRQGHRQRVPQRTLVGEGRLDLRAGDPGGVLVEQVDRGPSAPAEAGAETVDETAARLRRGCRNRSASLTGAATAARDERACGPGPSGPRVGRAPASPRPGPRGRPAPRSAGRPTRSRPTPRPAPAPARRARGDDDARPCGPRPAR